MKAKCKICDPPPIRPQQMKDEQGRDIARPGDTTDHGGKTPLPPGAIAAAKHAATPLPHAPKEVPLGDGALPEVE